MSLGCPQFTNRVCAWNRVSPFEQRSEKLCMCAHERLLYRAGVPEELSAVRHMTGDNCVLTNSSHPFRHVRHEENVQTCSLNFKQNSDKTPGPAVVMASPGGFSLLSPRLHLPLSSVSAPLWRPSLTPKPNGVLQSFSCYLSPSCLIPDSLRCYRYV